MTKRIGNSAEVVNIAGRQRMPTQRIARYAIGGIESVPKSGSMLAATGKLRPNGARLNDLAAAYERNAAEANEARTGVDRLVLLRDSLVMIAMAMTHASLGSDRCAPRHCGTCSLQHSMIW